MSYSGFKPCFPNGSTCTAYAEENLCKDLFLRQRMDADGWIPLPVIAGFNRVRMMTPEPSLVLDAIKVGLYKSNAVDC
jgi:hypothetical protein